METMEISLATPPAQAAQLTPPAQAAVFLPRVEATEPTQSWWQSYLWARQVPNQFSTRSAVNAPEGAESSSTEVLVAIGHA
eukprot:CAMPEP_0184307486 /NCGR_PEP_ID=MMETSP1049-20130417/16229_1 /TAXON_ID=77928 /ORGANISM="Proteomonas sulcata, Strain CCMP704" /LENGTH=80 /DNA_ID=CAMNT_0026619997 /DNA_START=132 /DNA_END=374 /DNA_ORIENTATION=+